MLETDIGIKLENPFILASGILDENGYTVKRVLESGAGAAVTKSIGSSERRGFEPPVIYSDDNYTINAIGLSNPGIEDYGNEIKIALQAGKPIIGSIFAQTPEEFASLAKKMQGYGASAIELNLSCPHVNGYGMEVGSDPELVSAVVSEVKSNVNIPVYAKLSPNTSDMIEQARAASKCDGYVLINTIKAMKIDINARMPVLSNVYGGLSGRSIKPVGIRYVYEVKKETGKNIIGVGGINTVEDVLEYIMAGASAVQIGSAISSHGVSLFTDLSKELKKYMEMNSINSIKDLVGVAIR
ncbi:MAG: dihydroorotate dehydrogenase [Candidatus Thermoplasmatota archaeon]|nr:dihydroorotate dehydrogenase [Candidatus Thermoplasmatota archaeon]